LIVEMHKRLGPRWSTIASEFPGRTVSSIRNRFLRLQNGNKLRDEGKITKNRCSKCGLPKKGHICSAKLTSDQSPHSLSDAPDAMNTGTGTAPLLARFSSNASYLNTLANSGMLTPVTRDIANWVSGENGLCGDALLSSTSDPDGIPVAQQLVDMSNKSEPSAQHPMNNDHLPVAVAVTTTAAPPSALPQHMLALVERRQSFSLPVPSPRMANASFQFVRVGSSEDAGAAHEAAAAPEAAEALAVGVADTIMFNADEAANPNPITTLTVQVPFGASDDEREKPSTPAAA